ncbi:MAG: FecR domain-containing protein [Porphyromonadaceae bacterium]|nr:FecR domain-containing protein [Porphyromonadaceae bacterium]
MEKELLYRFFEGRASREDQITIKEWMDLSEENRNIFFRERKIYDAIIVSGKAERLFETSPKSIRRLNWLRIPVAREFLKVASVVLLTLVGVWGYTSFEKQGDMHAMHTVIVPAGQHANVILPDGTSVWLNSETTIKYPGNFDKHIRNVVLNGEAYFDVTKNKKSPFVVTTNKGRIEVLGTSFNVEDYADSKIFETTLMKGSVKVSTLSSPENPVILSPATKSVLKNDKLVLEQVASFNSYRWKEGLICFKNDSFSFIMSQLEKNFGITIVVENSEVNKYKYTGKFRQTDGIDYALRILQKDISFTYNKDDENQIIHIK